MATQKRLTANVENWVRGSLQGAQSRLTVLEREASKVLKNLTQLPAQVQDMSKTAQRATDEVRKRWDALQDRVVQAAGVARQDQVEALHTEIAALSKKVDALMHGKRSAKGRPQA